MSSRQERRRSARRADAQAETQENATPPPAAQPAAVNLPELPERKYRASFLPSPIGDNALALAYWTLYALKHLCGIDTGEIVAMCIFLPLHEQWMMNMIGAARAYDVPTMKYIYERINYVSLGRQYSLLPILAYFALSFVVDMSDNLGKLFGVPHELFGVEAMVAVTFYASFAELRVLWRVVLGSTYRIIFAGDVLDGILRYVDERICIWTPIGPLPDRPEHVRGPQLPAQLTLHLGTRLVMLCVRLAMSTFLWKKLGAVWAASRQDEAWPLAAWAVIKYAWAAPPWPLLYIAIIRLLLESRETRFAKVWYSERLINGLHSAIVVCGMAIPPAVFFTGIAGHWTEEQGRIAALQAATRYTCPVMAALFVGFVVSAEGCPPEVEDAAWRLVPASVLWLLVPYDEAWRVYENMEDCMDTLVRGGA